MHTVRRTFHRGADLEAMSALARAYPVEHLHVIDLPYRFSSWALDDAASAGLWFAPGGRQIYVETDYYRNAALELYEAVGFRVFRDVLVYRKDYEK